MIAAWYHLIVLTDPPSVPADFFDQNPLSQLGLMTIRDGVAEKLMDLSGSPEAQIKKLRELQSGEGRAGEGCMQWQARETVCLNRID